MYIYMHTLLMYYLYTYIYIHRHIHQYAIEILTVLLELSTSAQKDYLIRKPPENCEWSGKPQTATARHPFWNSYKTRSWRSLNVSTQRSWNWRASEQSSHRKRPDAPKPNYTHHLLGLRAFTTAPHNQNIPTALTPPTKKTLSTRLCTCSEPQVLDTMPLDSVIL